MAAKKRENEQPPAKKEADISMAISGNLPADDKTVDGVRIVTTTNLHIQFVGPASKVMKRVEETARKLVRPGA